MNVKVRKTIHSKLKKRADLKGMKFYVFLNDLLERAMEKKKNLSKNLLKEDR
jgi:hypothetical protein